MSSKFTCRFCKEQFDVPKALYKHLQTDHNAGGSRENRYCPICGVLCSKYDSYRDHLLYIHGQANDGQQLTFKSLNDFLVWKTELEMKNNCKYMLQTTPKVLSNKEKKYFYQCDRANPKAKDKKSSVAMKTCSSMMSVLEGAGAFKVEYWETHSNHEMSSASSVQSELEAAISSVDMVNAIGDSDDSLERSEMASENSSSEKQANFSKSSPGTNENNLKTTRPPQKGVAKKKTNNTSILFSLASVACGKGIIKKPSPKVTESKEKDAVPVSQPESSTTSKTSETSKESTSTNEENTDSALVESSINQVSPQVTTTISQTPVTTKITGLQPIAPKLSTTTTNIINSPITTTNTLSNQFVIVNPMGMDQNSSFAAGQNILLSLGPKIIPEKKAQGSIPATSSSTLNINEKKTIKTLLEEREINKPLNNNSKSTASVVNTNSTITLSPGLNNAPVILSSLPVGSTFMSVNNSLIPIASPSGAFIPTSLPPNIVLTPVAPNTTLSNVKLSKTNASSAMPLSSTLKNTTQIQHFTTPSTVAVTVSSIVKEPLFTSAIKQPNSILSNKTLTPHQQQVSSSKFVPQATVTSGTSVSKTPTSSPRKSVKKLLTHFLDEDPDDPPEVSMPKKSARKQITRPTKKLPPTPVIKSVDSLSDFNTKVVNSSLNLTPISSTTNVTMTPQVTVPTPTTMIFESASGEVFMLEPMENNSEHLAPTKHNSLSEPYKIKIDRAAQTTEDLLELKTKVQMKRAAPVTDDSAVMLKVRCFQLEMKYLSSQTDCKRLKIELAKEKMKNAELSGEKDSINLKDDSTNDSSTNTFEMIKDIDDKCNESKNVHIYTMTKTSVLRSLYEDLEQLCAENNQLHKELENYRAHDKFYKSLMKRIHDE